VVERLELPKLALQPKVEAKFKVTPIRVVEPLRELELQQPRRVNRAD
jgi:hypothetical protein